MIMGTDLKLRPIYHLMYSKVNKKGEFQTQILFAVQNIIEKARLN